MIVELLMLITILMGIALLFTKWVRAYNHFKWMQTTSEQYLADVKMLIQQRIAMLNSLSAVVKKYGIHEHSTLEDTIKARGQGSMSSQIQAVDNAFIRINALQEQYPQLKANTLFQSLAGKDSISSIEERVRFSIQHYNYMVALHNTYARQFPTLLLAQIHKIKLLEHIKFNAEYKIEEVYKNDTAQYIKGYQ